VALRPALTVSTSQPPAVRTRPRTVARPNQPPHRALDGVLMIFVPLSLLARAASARVASMRLHKLDPEEYLRCIMRLVPL
jgi:hypothetical protein